MVDISKIRIGDVIEVSYRATVVSLNSGSLTHPISAKDKHGTVLLYSADEIARVVNSYRQGDLVTVKGLYGNWEVVATTKDQAWIRASQTEQIVALDRLERSHDC